MPPNWKKFQNITHNMIEDMLGGMPCTITTPSYVVYDTLTGEEKVNNEVTHINLTLIPTNKDDLKDLPEGLRDRKIAKIYTVEPIEGSPIITTDFDGINYEVVVPSVAYTAGGMVHCYRTFIAKIETDGIRPIPPIEDNNDDDNQGI